MLYFRILDLSVNAITKTEELEFTWTSPGQDFDIGKPTSYQLFYAKNPQVWVFTTTKKKKVLEFTGFIDKNPKL